MLAPAGHARGDDAVGEARLDVLAGADFSGAADERFAAGTGHDREAALERRQRAHRLQRACGQFDAVAGGRQIPLPGGPESPRRRGGTQRLRFELRAGGAQPAFERPAQPQLQFVQSLCMLAEARAGMRAPQPFLPRAEMRGGPSRS